MAIPFVTGFARTVVIGALILFAGACVPLMVGGSSGASVAYVAGEMQAQEDVSLDEAWIATRRALQTLELDVTVDEKDSLSAHLVGRGAEDKKISVRLERVSPRTTTVKIRVGIIGDQAFSMQVLDQIEEELGLNGGAPHAQLP